jgi:type VI secretion system secreted protein Hcp
MPLPIHLECTAKKQGKISGSCDMLGREETIIVYGLYHTFMIPHNPLDGLPSGQRKHAPISIVKEIDSATPGFYQALVTGEQFYDVTFKYYDISESGTEVHFYSQSLKNASIISMRNQTPVTFLKKNEPFRHMEIVSFSYENIEWSNNVSNTRSEDKKCKSTSPFDDIMNGLEFAFKAIFEITKFNVKTVSHDVQMSLLNYIPMNPGLGFYVGRGLSIKEISENFNCSEETIVNLSKKIEEIRIKTVNN